MADKRRRDRDDEGSAKKGGAPILFIVLGVGGLLLLLALCGGGGLAAFWFFHTDPARPPVEPPPGVQAKFTKADIHKIEAGMTPEDVTAVIGQGRAVGQDEMRHAFGAMGDDATAKWQASGREAGVTTWRQWQNGEESIFVGFGVGKKSGKDRVLTSFWVRRKANGFESDIGLLPLPILFGGDPDDVAAEREEKNKIFNDPKFKGGDAKKLIVGRWLDEVRNGYDFRADGTYERVGRKYNGTYRFTGADEIEIHIPPGAEFVGGKGFVQKYRVWVGAEDMIMQSVPGQLKLTYTKRK